MKCGIVFLPWTPHSDHCSALTLFPCISARHCHSCHMSACCHHRCSAFTLFPCISAHHCHSVCPLTVIIIVAWLSLASHTAPHRTSACCHHDPSLSLPSRVLAPITVAPTNTSTHNLHHCSAVIRPLHHCRHCSVDDCWSISFYIHAQHSLSTLPSFCWYHLVSHR